MKLLHSRIDTLMAKIPSFDCAEDVLPAQLGEASPRTHLALYQDRREGPSIVGEWARRSLLLAKLEVAIMLRKLVLGSPGLTSSHRLWSRCVTSQSYIFPLKAMKLTFKKYYDQDFPVVPGLPSGIPTTFSNASFRALFLVPRGVLWPQTVCFLDFDTPEALSKAPVSTRSSLLRG